jgi:hypothetical protein
VKRLRWTAAVWLAWWSFLFLLWLLYVGEWNRYAWVAGAAAASVAATSALIVHELGLLRFRPEWHWLLRSKSVPAQVFVDFWILVVALFQSVIRRRPVQGVFRANEFPAGGTDPGSCFRRAWAATLAAYSPNAYGIDIDPKRKTALVHDLVPNRASEEPL